MKILLYRGESWISKAIKWQTRSPYSHAAIQLDDGSVVEAWHIGGVSHVSGPGVNHTPGTEIDVFGFSRNVSGRIDHNRATAEAWLLSQVGARYDYRGVLRFVSRRDWPANDAWFCSELVAEFCAILGVQLLDRIPWSHVSPAMIGYSPRLDFIERIES